MLERYLGTDEHAVQLWSELGRSSPNLYTLARLCSQPWLRTASDSGELSLEARAILVLARPRGMFELKVANTSANAVERLLTVFIDIAPDQLLALRIRNDLQASLRLFDGFRQLCAAGMVMHHQFNEFSLTNLGFLAAEAFSRVEVGELLAKIENASPCD